MTVEGSIKNWSIIQSFPCFDIICFYNGCIFKDKYFFFSVSIVIQNYYAILEFSVSNLQEVFNVSWLSIVYFFQLRILKKFSYFQCLRKWGYRRCEDICWIKTNKNNPGKTKTLDPKAVFQRTKVLSLLFSFLYFNYFLSSFSR